jgi:large subunit ribosomal protein L4
MSTLEAVFFKANGEAKGKIPLPETIFAGNGSRHTLHEIVVSLQANQRRGTSMTKTRGLVTGGGHKPWKQKGTGNARAGSIRSPLWRKGGIIFGPKPRSYRTDLGEKKRLLALQTALVEKARASEIAVIESFPDFEGKTRNAEQLLKKTGLTGRTLIIFDKKDDAMARALKNISHVNLADIRGLNAWLVLSAKQMIFSQTALKNLADKFPKGK